MEQRRVTVLYQSFSREELIAVCSIDSKAMTRTYYGPILQCYVAKTIVSQLGAKAGLIETLSMPEMDAEEILNSTAPSQRTCSNKKWVHSAISRKL